MNVMLVAVRERTREIGLRLAVGATRGQILQLFFLETFFIVFGSGAVGFGLAHGLCAFVNTFKMPPYFAGLIATWQVSLACVLLLGLVAFLSALYPASRAASIDPVEALRWEAGG
jgi:putative ABC transport system permease protein